MRNLRLLSVIIIPVMFVLNSCNFEVTTANVSGIKICEDLNGNLCGEDQTLLSPGVRQICASCNLNNAPSNTLVTFTWKYMEEPQLVIDQVTLNSADKGTNLELHSSLSRPYNGWPTGKYCVEVSIGENDQSPEIKHFEIR